MQPITTLLMDMRRGRSGAAGELLAIIYEDLRRLAAHNFRGEKAGHTLQPTALVHELFIRLFAGETVSWSDRAHFFAVASQQIRRILVDHARSRRAQKRGGGDVRVTLAEFPGPTAAIEDVLAVHEALLRLEALDSRAARIVELRFFGGLEEKEAAEVLGISLATLKRDWQFARAWLQAQLKSVK
jgi:RNA polymerase sigma factor (TIGR02999 family)